MKEKISIQYTRKEKILLKRNKIQQEITTITHRGSSWEFNTATGECKFICRKLSKEEEQKVENLKAKLKVCEAELKVAELEEDFECINSRIEGIKGDFK